MGAALTTGLSTGLILPMAGAQAAAAPAGAEFAKPKGLLPGGQSDSRFPVSFATPVTEGMRLVIEYFTALNQRDVAAIAKTLHFHCTSRLRSTNRSSPSCIRPKRTFCAILRRR
jgi:hypothetical protein